eukprot:TRINITY_DN976_c0_g1_i20.p1 TRINITY_DN976_c0_g1~~TRINITY_DN976_c0_g1_i20.p1  ORF type:complete len:115 (-),score=7.28 TRINITY_DN976_c0_g1_i20:914-1258(-)
MLININVILPHTIWIKGICNIVTDCLSRLIKTEEETVNLVYNVPPSFWHKILKTYHGGWTVPVQRQCVGLNMVGPISSYKTTFQRRLYYENYMIAYQKNGVPYSHKTVMDEGQP